MPFQVEEGLVFLTPSEIWFVEAVGHYSVLYHAEGEYTLKHSFNEIMKMLGNPREFVQCHRSYLVNMQHVSAITKLDVIMDNKAKVPISRRAYKAVNQAFIANYELHT